ncbi:hypothetical protein [Tianweitania sediminis]|uniref:Uncharacterized protein n=1 Tax=Tianweitania sediminis TaxID=1502156 RepID=A0A8J7UK45_9HYPH|nr:hypothetical protein [Tianweitania sediminis]MBP0437992.1 hypothetical protein [Tianweitania sediminis]
MSLGRSTSEKWPSGIVGEFTWPPGAKTVVPREGDRAEVNGTDTVARVDSVSGTCFLNRSSGNDFCVRRAER